GVGVEHHDGGSAGMVEAGRERRLMAEVSCQINEPDPRVAFGEPLQNRRRGVGGAVIDQHQLEVQPFERGAHAAVELLDGSLFVVYGGDHAQQSEHPPAVGQLVGARATHTYSPDPMCGMYPTSSISWTQPVST